MPEKNTITPRQELQNHFGPIDDHQWQWLKEFCERHYIPSTRQMLWTPNGDMITKPGQVFRQIGWQINGGEMDGLFLKPEFLDHFTETGPTHGGFSPVYVEVGTD